MWRTHFKNTSNPPTPPTKKVTTLKTLPRHRRQNESLKRKTQKLIIIFQSINVKELQTKHRKVCFCNLTNYKTIRISDKCMTNQGHFAKSNERGQNTGIGQHAKRWAATEAKYTMRQCFKTAVRMGISK